jgi:hypothetical protein
MAAKLGNPEGPDARPRKRCRSRAKYFELVPERGIELLQDGLFSVG